MGNSGHLTWLITGASSGFGYRLALIALQRGDNVLATSRSLTKIQKLVDDVSRDVDTSKKDRLKVFQMELSDSEETMKKLAEEAVGVWGRIDVLVNNAGKPLLSHENYSVYDRNAQVGHGEV